MNITTRSEHELQVQTRQHLRGLIARAQVFFTQQETENLNRVREHILHSIDASPLSARTQNLCAATVLLDKNADDFNQAFRAAIQANMQEEALRVFPEASTTPKQPAPVTPGDVDGMSLSLIDMDEVDRILLLDRIAHRFNTYFEPSLVPLTRRLSVLLNQPPTSLSGNPFRPEVFVRSFAQAWERSEFAPHLIEDLLLSLEPQHVMDLALLYQELDQVLAQLGVSDQPVLRIRRTEGEVSDYVHLTSTPDTPAATGDQPQQSRHRRSSRNTSSPVHGLAPVGRSITAQARNFLQRLGLISRPGKTSSQQAAPSSDASSTLFDASAPIGHSGGDLEFMGVMGGEQDQSGIPTIVPADPEFMGYLGDLQAEELVSFSQTVFDGKSPADHNILRQLRDMEQVRQAPELDRGTVDALAEVFHYVFADPSIPVQMKFVIGRLQIPVLKAAMINRDFFLSGDHPARCLVDTLARASIAWSPEKGEGDALYVNIERTVQRVLNEFESDLELFRNLLQSFNEFLSESEQQAQGRIEPTADHERSKEAHNDALAQAKSMVLARINAHPPSLHLANFLVSFLSHQWREVMALARLKAANAPFDWETAVQTMDQLIWSTQSKTTEDERRQFVKMLPVLVRNLNAGLDAIDWNGQARDKFTRRLITKHTLAIRISQTSAPDSFNAALDERATGAGQETLQELNTSEPSKRSESEPESEDEFDNLAHSFTRGMWFDFTEEAGNQHRCKLSWVSPMRTRLLFTNREGFDAFVRSEHEVATLLRLRRLSVIDQTPIVARALDHIMAAEEEALEA